VFAVVAGAAGVATDVVACVVVAVESSDDDRFAFAAGRVEALELAVTRDDRPVAAVAAVVRVGTPPRAR
jgi:hypothetical protein